MLNIAITLQFDESAEAIFQRCSKYRCSEMFCKIHRKTPFKEFLQTLQVFFWEFCEIFYNTNPVSCF